MIRFLIVLTLNFAMLQAFGWGSTGHRTVGKVAEKYLNAKAKKKLKALLNNQSLAMLANWMDDVKSDSLYDHMEDWHWVTIETGQTYAQSNKNANGDLIMTLERITNELSSHKLSGEKEIEAVKILIHLMGDIHQPLHVGCCDDAGGNRVKVKWFRNDSNLHTVWDTEIINDSRLSYTELAESLEEPSAEVIKRLQSSTVRDIANESIALRKQVYAIGDGNLGYRYIYKNMPTIRKRIQEAGIRLAGVLNQIYGK